MSNRTDLTDAYFRALGLADEAKDAGNDNKRKDALARAHQLRSFEIDNYWKRATYFWSFQAIAFAVLGFTLENGALPQAIQILQIPAAIGAISGFVGYLSAKGSKYWQENWEAHVDMLESDSEGRLTQSIWSDGRRSHSVSRLNQAFMGMTTLSWIAVMAIASAGGIPAVVAERSPWWMFFLLLASMTYLWARTQQNFSGQASSDGSWYEMKPNPWWSRKIYSNNDRQLLLRDIKAKKAVAPEP